MYATFLACVSECAEFMGVGRIFAHEFGHSIANLGEEYPAAVNGTYYFCDTNSDHDGRLFGLANERQICRYIEIYTGDAGGACDELCIDGSCQ